MVHNLGLHRWIPDHTRMYLLFLFHWLIPLCFIISLFNWNGIVCKLLWIPTAEKNGLYIITEQQAVLYDKTHTCHLTSQNLLFQLTLVFILFLPGLPIHLQESCNSFWDPDLKFKNLCPQAAKLEREKSLSEGCPWC